MPNTELPRLWFLGQSFFLVMVFGIPHSPNYCFVHQSGSKLASLVVGSQCRTLGACGLSDSKELFLGSGSDRVTDSVQWRDCCFWNQAKSKL